MSHTGVRRLAGGLDSPGLRGHRVRLRWDRIIGDRPSMRSGPGRSEPAWDTRGRSCPTVRSGPPQSDDGRSPWRACPATQSARLLLKTLRIH
jgi:hypothetical protein